MNNFFEIKYREQYRSELVSKWGEGHWLVKQFDEQCAENDEIISGKKSRPTMRAADGACESCKLQFTSSCPSLLGKLCSYYQPRR